MSSRKAFDIKSILWIYNLWHFLGNVAFFYLASSLGWLTTYSWRSLNRMIPLEFLSRLYTFQMRTSQPLDHRSTHDCKQNVTLKFSHRATPHRFQIASVCWWFLMFKFVDFLETLILVCGKRSELITKFHVLHHFLMPR